MIIRRGTARDDQGDEDRSARYGAFERLAVGDTGGLAQVGVFVETLQPGSRTVERHWHERSDELIYVVAGEVTVVENDGEHVLVPGDAACWPAGVANAHQLVNRSAAPCTYVLVGTRPGDDKCHYPDLGQVQIVEGDAWRIVDAVGVVLRSGKV